MTIFAALVMRLLLAGAAQVVPPPAQQAPTGACRLLTAEDIERVQSASLTSTKASQERGKAAEFEQCFFATGDFARSVSLTIIRGPGGTAAATRAYWDRTFAEERRREKPRRAGSRPGKAEPGEKEASPEPVSGLGHEAYWTGSAKAGALYVLADTAVVRISVGGVTDEHERLRRSKVLAEAALKRLPPAPKNE